MKDMKKIILKIFFGAAILGFSSCQDFLDTSSPSTFTPAIVYENALMANQAVLGIYDCLTADETYSQNLSWVFVCGSDIEIRSFTLNSIDASRAPAHFLADASNDKLSKTWTALYGCIERASVAIDGIENSDIYKDSSHPDHAAMRQYRAEAIALRALCYQDLTRNFGNVPFKLVPSQPDLSNAYLPKTDRMEIFEQLLTQLIESAGDLPWKQLTPERITQGFARGLAARLALCRAGWDYSTEGQWVAPRADAAEYYKIAKEQCEKVIKEGGYDLESSYYTYFYKQCQRQYSDIESLFEIGFQLGRSSEMGYSTGVRYRVSTTKYGYTTQGQVQTTPAYYYSFHPEDERRDVSVVYYCYDDLGFEDAVNGVSRDLLDGGTFGLNKWSVKWAPADFAAASLAFGGKYGTGINYPMMRYPEILLMYAEADYNLNGTVSAEAKDAVWKVRKRAIPTLTSGDFDAYLASKDFQQVIEDERMWEFAGEGLRKYDLIRWGKLPQALKTMHEVNAAIYRDPGSYHFEFPTRSDGKERAIPAPLYYLYDENVEDFADVNIDYALSAVPGPAYLEGKILPTSEESITRAISYINQCSSGCVSESGAYVQNGRPFQPMPQSVIDAYGEEHPINQDYGF